MNYLERNVEQRERPNVQNNEEVFRLDETQLAAIERCCDLSERIVPVTGAAGTGKTTILQNVYRRLYNQNCQVVL